MKRLLIVALLGAWVPTLNAATGCVLIGEGAASVQVGGEERAPPLRLTACDGAKVLAGTVTACFLNEKNERTCRSLKSGESFEPSALGAQQGAKTGTFRATLASLFKGDPQARIGQTRAEPPYAGFPYRAVLLPQGDLVIPLQTSKTKRVQLFTLITPGIDTKALSFTPQNGRLVVPAKALVRGHEYSWEATGENVRFAGRFSFAGADEVSRIEQLVSKIKTNAALGDVAQRILVAEIYFEQGYAFDAAALIEPPGANTTASH